MDKADGALPPEGEYGVVQPPQVSSSPVGAGENGTSEEEEDERFYEAQAEDLSGAGEEWGDEVLPGMANLSVSKDPAKAKEMKDKGNRLYQAKDFEGAIECYSLAIRHCPYELKPEVRKPPQPRVPRDDMEGGKEEGGQQQELEQQQQQEKDEAPVDEPFAEFKGELAVYYGNRAACHAALKRDKEAVADCTEALRLKPDYIKVLLRRAAAAERLDKLEDALKDYKQVVELDPTVREARAKIPGLERACAERMEKLKTETLGKLKELGNSFLSNFGLSTDNFKMVQDPNTGSYSISFQK